MPTIFCDVDGTLRTPDTGEVNLDLVNALLDVVTESREHRLVVWSGGGQLYAAHWAVESGLFEFTDAELAKRPGVVQDGDIVVDDMLEEDIRGLIGRATGVHVYTPEAFIAGVAESRMPE